MADLCGGPHLIQEVLGPRVLTPGKGGEDQSSLYPATVSLFAPQGCARCWETVGEQLAFAQFLISISKRAAIMEVGIWWDGGNSSLKMLTLSTGTESHETG